MTDPTLSLYRIPGCPYCIRVEREIARLGVPVELRDITRDSEHLRTLLVARGRRTTPVLRIQTADSDTFMPESADIIAWLRGRFGG